MFKYVNGRTDRRVWTYGPMRMDVRTYVRTDVRNKMLLFYIFYNRRRWMSIVVILHKIYYHFA